MTAFTVRRLSEHELRQLRAETVNELVSAVRGHADREHLDQLTRLLGRLDRRLDRLAGRPSVTRRQELASAR